MYELKKLLDKEKCHFLFQNLTGVCNIQTWFGVCNTTGQILVQHPEQERTQISPSPEERRQKDKGALFFEHAGLVCSALATSNFPLGYLLAKPPREETGSFLLFLEILHNLLTSQLAHSLEKKIILRETLDTYKEINLLYNIGNSISECTDIEQLTKTILRESIKIIKTTSCSLMLLDKKSGRLYIKAALGEKNPHPVELESGKGVAGLAVQQGKTIICNSVAEDNRFVPGNKQLRDLLCVPLKTKEQVLGVLNFSDKKNGQIFTARDAKLLTALAAPAANFIESTLRHEQKLNEDRLKRNLERYLSPHLAKQLLDSSHELRLGGERKKVAVLFADIRNFSGYSEEVAPERLVKSLNKYFSSMVDIIFKYRGTIDKFVGDEIMAVFGAPISHKDNEVRAIRAAVEMQKKMADLRLFWEKKQVRAFNIGIGINSGIVIAGNIGSQRHMDYTVIGDAVNIAKRLETQATEGKILISRNIYNQAKDSFAFHEFGEIFVKGKKKPVEVFEVLY